MTDQSSTLSVSALWKYEYHAILRNELLHVCCGCDEEFITHTIYNQKKILCLDPNHP